MSCLRPRLIDCLEQWRHRHLTPAGRSETVVPTASPGLQSTSLSECESRSHREVEQALQDGETLVKNKTEETSPNHVTRLSTPFIFQANSRSAFSESKYPAGNQPLTPPSTPPRRRVARAHRRKVTPSTVGCSVQTSTDPEAAAFRAIPCGFRSPEVSHSKASPVIKNWIASDLLLLARPRVSRSY
jgi:hypothetical protein